jgi:predicted transcriptional regulator
MGISKERNEEIIKRLSELVQVAKRGSYTSTSELISLIADEPTFTKKECVYIGILLAAMYDTDDNC